MSLYIKFEMRENVNGILSANLSLLIPLFAGREGKMEEEMG
jgi:hypothetical protein